MKPTRPFFYIPGRITAFFSMFGLVIFLLFPMGSAEALSSTATIHKQDSSVNLEPYLTIIEDKDSNKGVSDIIIAVKNEGLVPLENQKTNFGRTNSTYWGYVELFNDSDVERTVVYEIAGRNEHIEFFIENESGGFIKKTAGTMFSYLTSELKYRNIGYDIKLGPNETKKVILKNSSLLIRFPVKVWDKDIYIDKVTKDAILLGITYGIFLIMFVYNLFLLFFLKEITYLHYILLVLSNWFFFMVINGTAFKYIWPNQPFWETRSYMFFNTVTMVLLFQFVRSFLETRKFAPRLDKLIKIWIVLCGFGVVASVGMDFISSRTLLPFINFPGLVFAITVGVIMLRKQRIIAASYLISFIPTFFGTLVYLLKQFGVLPFNLVTEYSLQIGFVMQIAFVSVALANKINMLKSRLIVVEQAALESQKDLTRELSDKVRERTNELETANAELEKLSQLDSLTSLYNRRFLDEFLQVELNQHAADNEMLSLLICDIDFFKNYNDTYGHVAGDQCIMRVAEVIRESCGSDDIAARFGGEEFVVILPRTNEERASGVGDAIRNRVAELLIPHSASLIKETVTISVGIATGIPSFGADKNELLKMADEALYASKEKGRNTVTRITFA